MGGGLPKARTATQRPPARAERGAAGLSPRPQLPPGQRRHHQRSRSEPRAGRPLPAGQTWGPQRRRARPPLRGSSAHLAAPEPWKRREPGAAGLRPPPASTRPSERPRGGRQARALRPGAESGGSLSLVGVWLRSGRAPRGGHGTQLKQEALTWASRQRKPGTRSLLPRRRREGPPAPALPFKPRFDAAARGQRRLWGAAAEPGRSLTAGRVAAPARGPHAGSRAHAGPGEPGRLGASARHGRGRHTRVGTPRGRVRSGPQRGGSSRLPGDRRRPPPRAPAARSRSRRPAPRGSRRARLAAPGAKVHAPREARHRPTRPAWPKPPLAEAQQPASPGQRPGTNRRRPSSAGGGARDRGARPGRGRVLLGPPPGSSAPPFPRSDPEKREFLLVSLRLV